MANYTGGGGGGAAVVPATFVVASDREDYPLTEAGLAQAIADLPAGGGTIYIGEGTLVITTPIVLSKNIKIVGAGIGITIFSVTTGISVFTAGDVGFTLLDFSVIGNNTAAQAFLTLTASASTGKFGMIERVQVGTLTGFGTDNGTKIFIDAATFVRVWYLNDLTLVMANGSSFYANGGSGTMRATNISGFGLISGSLVMDATNVTISSDGGFAFGNQGKFTNCRFTGTTFAPGTQTLVSNSFLIVTTVTFGNESLVTNSFIQGAVTFGNTCNVSNCKITGAPTFGTSGVMISCSVTGAAVFGNTAWLSANAILGALTVGSGARVTSTSATGATTTGTGCDFSGCSLDTVSAQANNLFSSCDLAAVTAVGSKVRVVGCILTSFTCTTAGADNHVLQGNSFTGGGNNVTLTDCDGCVVTGNTTCQVNETASSDANRFDNNGGFSGSTIIGPNSTVNGAKRYGATGATTDAYATLFTVTNSKGLLGYGTIKNTDGADSMTVEEQGIDAFGPTTDVKESVVAPGDELPLDPTNFVGTARPPYTSYRVRVKSTSAGNAAAHSTQFVSQGDMA